MPFIKHWEWISERSAFILWNFLTHYLKEIKTSFIFSELTEGISQKNFAQLDAYPYAEAGTLEKKLDEVFE